MQIAEQFHAAGLPVFPCRDKVPAVSRGQDWKLIALEDPQSLTWPSPVIGVPVPAGCVVIDLDTYKGVTREAVELHLGCALDWDAALLQITPSGGEHYGFAVDWNVRQGDSLDGIKGLDTRCANKGYICTGGPYRPQGFGPMRMAHPAALPRLPDACRPVLEHVERPVADRPELPTGDRDLDALTAALRHIDPGCSRSDWVRVGLGLRHHFHDEEYTGEAMFAAWSSGEFWPDGTPENYVPEHLEGQWASFKPEGDTTIATVYYAAMQGGWHPPATFDTALAFGPGACEATAFEALVERINAHGSDSRCTQDLIAEIQQAGCNELQATLLRNELKAALRDGKLLDKGLASVIDQQLTPQAAPRVAPEVKGLHVQQISRPSSTQHGTNALGIIGEIYHDQLAVISGVLRWWDGTAWRLVASEDLERVIWAALLPDHSKKSTVSGTRDAVLAFAPRREGRATDRRVYFQNGVLDPMTGTVVPHHIDNGNLGTLMCDWDPMAPCPEWHAFVASIFGGEEDGDDRAALLQEILGWTLIRDSLNAQKIVALDGASRGGKGAIFEVLTALLGHDTAGVMSFCDLSDGKTQSAFRAYDVMFDYDATPPPRQNMKAAIGFMNKLASNEVVSIQLLNTQTPWQGRLNAKVLINCNGIPTMLDDSGATANRFLVLRFTRTFAGREDKTLVGRLLTELPGIAAWAVVGLQRLLANGGAFTTPATSTDATEELRSTNQPMREFIGEYLEIDPKARCHLSEIWQSYRLYCQDANVSLPTRAMFSRSLKKTLMGSGAIEKKGVRIGDKVSVGFIGMQLAADRNPFAPRLESVG